MPDQTIHCILICCILINEDATRMQRDSRSPGPNSIICVLVLELRLHCLFDCCVCLFVVKLALRCQGFRHLRTKEQRRKMWTDYLSGRATLQKVTYSPVEITAFSLKESGITFVSQKQKEITAVTIYWIKVRLWGDVLIVNCKWLFH